MNVSLSVFPALLHALSNSSSFLFASGERPAWGKQEKNIKSENIKLNSVFSQSRIIKEIMAGAQGAETSLREGAAQGKGQSSSYKGKNRDDKRAEVRVVPKQVSCASGGGCRVPHVLLRVPSCGVGTTVPSDCGDSDRKGECLPRFYS